MALKIDMLLGSRSAGKLVKFRNDTKILTHNLASSRFHLICQQDVLVLMIRVRDVKRIIMIVGRLTI